MEDERSDNSKILQKSIERADVTIKRSLVRVAMAIAGAAMLVTVGSPTVSAEPVSVATARNGVCEGGEICFYYLEGLSGSLSDFNASLDNYGSTQPGCYEFKSSGFGSGECIKNNARSAWNRSGRTVRVFFNSYYGGNFDAVPAGTWRNLNVTYDNNASHKFL